MRTQFIITSQDTPEIVTCRYSAPWNEYTVSYSTSPEATYFTTDAKDALDTALAAYKNFGHFLKVYAPTGKMAAAILATNDGA